MRRLPSLPALRAFEAAARHRSFKQAAEELHVTPTAISHQVRGLEAQLSVPLFERRTRQVVLTAEGLALYPVLREGFDRFAAALESIRPGRLARPVTLSATPAFAAMWLLPRLPRFQADHPDIDLRLHASNAVVDLEAGGIDLALRYGHGPYPGLAATALLEDRFVPVASPRLALRRRADLARHPLIHFEWHRPDPRHPGWPLWLRHTPVEGVDGRRGLHFTEESHAIQAAIAGQGVALLSEALVSAPLAQGTLVVPFGPALPGFIYHLVHRETPALGEAALAVKRWLRAQAAPSGGHTHRSS